MGKVFCLLVGLCLSMAVSAQQKGEIKGVITDQSNGLTLPGANITLPDGTGTTTNIDGKYSIEVSPGTYKVTYSFIGFAKQTKTVTVAAGESKAVNIKLGTDAKQLEMVVVSASKFEQRIEEVAVSMEVLKPDLIQNKNTTSIESALDQVPGCTVQDGQISIRGGSGFAYGAGSRVLLVVDGLPLLAGDAGDAKWNTLPLENVQQVEVMKGASSVLFGSSALNGVINLRTSYPKDEPVTKVTVFHGVYDSPARQNSTNPTASQDEQIAKWWDGTQYFTGMNYLHSRKFGKNFDFTTGGAYFLDKGYKEGEWEQRGRMNVNMRYRSEKVKGLSYGLNGSHQDSEGGLYILWMDADSGALRPSGGLDPASTTISDYRSTRSNLDPYVEWWASDDSRFTLRNRWYQTHNRNNTNQGSLSNLYYSELQYQKNFTDSTTLTSGLVYTGTSVKADLYGDHTATNVAFFTQFDKKWGRFTASGGIRGEYFKIDTFESTSSISIGSSRLPIQPVIRAGMTYRVAKATHLRASYGQGYRFPSVAEKFVQTSVGPLQIFPNPGLEPETGWSAEIGVKQGFKIGEGFKGYLDLALFTQEYRNMMEFTFGVYNPDSVQLTFTPGTPGYLLNWAGFRAENVETSRISGIDISVVGTGAITDDLSITVLAGYTYMNPVTFNTDSAYLASFSDTSSNLLKYRYRHLAKGDIQLDYKKWSLGFSGRYNSFMENIDRAFQDLNVPVNNGFIPLGDIILPGIEGYRAANNRGDLVFDARLSFQITENAKLSVIANNVMNREYTSRPGDIQAPRTYIGQLNVSF